MRFPKLFAAITLLAVLAGVLGWALGSTAGLRFTLARVLPLLPADIEIGVVEGRLWGPLALHDVQVAAPGLEFTATRLALDWKPAALVARTLHVRELAVDSPHVVLTGSSVDEDPPPAATQDGGAFSLPLDLRLERLEIRAGTLQSGEELLVENLELRLGGHASGQRLAIDHLSLDSSRGTLAGHADLSLAPGERWDVALDWQVELEDFSVAGRSEATGTLAALDIAQTLTTPVEVQLRGTLLDLPRSPAWTLVLQLQPLAARGGPWPELLDGLSAEVSLEGSLAASRLSGGFELPALLDGRVGLDAAAGWEDDGLRLDGLVLGLPDGGRLQAEGRIEPAAMAAELVISGEALGWPLDGTDTIVALPRLVLRIRGADQQWVAELDGHVVHEALPELEFSAALEWLGPVLNLERLALRAPDDELLVTGRGALNLGDAPPSYRVEIAGDIRLPEFPPAQFSVLASGDTSGVELETLAAQLLDGTVQGHGRIAWEGTLASDLQLEFADLNPAGLLADWPGRLSGSLSLAGLPTTADGLDLVLSELRGELKSLPISGAAALNIAGEQVTLHQARLAVGQNTLQAAGQADAARLDLRAELLAPALQELDAALRGSLQATARVSGARSEPRLQLEAEGTRLRWQENRLRSLRADADLDLSGTQTSQLLVDIEGLATAPEPGMRIQLEGSGTPLEHAVRLELVQARPARSLLLAAGGSFAQERWSGRVEELALAEADQPVWTLQAPAELEASAERIVLRDTCMDGTLGRLCVDGRWLRSGPWSGHALLSTLDLAPLSEWLAPGIQARGIVTGEVTVSADDRGFQAMAGELVLTEGDIRTSEEDSQPLVAWAGGQVQLDGDPALARLSLSLALAGADRVEGSLAIGWNLDDPTLEGSVHAESSRLALIAELLPELADLDGRAAIYGAVSGTLGAPEITGRFEWQEGRAEIPALGLRPQDLSVVATLAEGVLDLAIRGRSGDGEFEGDGRFDLTADGVNGRANLRGTDVLVADLPEARVTASSDLRFHYFDNDLVVGGELRIPFARITGLGGPTAIRASPDAVIVGTRAQAEPEGLRVTSRVRVTVGPDVQVQAAGLRGRVEGNLLTVTEPEALPWGRGELRVVDGTFGAFGQRLEIETGRLIYAGGPLENPGLEIRAVRRVDQVTAGALVRGTLQEPQITIFSDPPMPSAEALSYLTLGKSLQDLQSSEQRSVNQAANSLALTGGGLIAKDLGRRLGFDDVSVAADDDTGGAALVVGKYLGPGLFVSYGLGLFDTVNTLRLRYQLRPRVTIEASSGAEAAADVFFTWERD